tara:strand:- start:11265 stop:12188 length:924 start_codon:yes stop_codon:yes gene_type:complete
MKSLYQHTLTESVEFEGIGLHSGKKSRVKLIPASEDFGIVFKRIDVNINNTIKANYKNVSSAKLCTTLENQTGLKVSTVEHLLAAFYITGIDNVLIEIDNEEVPIMDGSSKEFIEVLQSIGNKELSKKRKYLKVLKRVEIKENEKSIVIEPSEELDVSFQLNYNNKIIGKQKSRVNFSDKKLKDVYSSRTFCLFEDIEKIKRNGLAKGGSLENAIVVDENKVINKEGLRNEKEFANHKILDLAGDFLLSGYRILGKVNCHQGGHQLTNSFLKKLLKSKGAFKVLELESSKSRRNLTTSQSIKLAVNA